MYQTYPAQRCKQSLSPWRSGSRTFAPRFGNRRLDASSQKPCPAVHRGASTTFVSDSNLPMGYSA